MRNGSLVRVLDLMNKLKRGRFTLRQLAENYDVHPRTIRRDLEAMSNAGVPVTNYATSDDQGLNVIWWIQR